MIALLVNLLFAALAAQSITPGTGRIIGRVVDAETGAAVGGVRVYLNGPVSPTTPWPPGPLPASTPVLPQGRSTPATPPRPPDPDFFTILQRLTSETRADGMFEIRDVPDGRWAVVAQKTGFISNRGLSSPLIVMEAGRRLTVPDIRLDRGGVIVGRILDAKGKPMSGVQVRTAQLRKQLDGTLQPNASSEPFMETNDLGEFRLSGIPPGEHYVVAHPPGSPLASLLLGGRTPAPTHSAYVPTFYPGFTNAAVASLVKVTGGATTSAIEFSLYAVPAYQVSGVVVDGAGQPVSGAIVRLAPRRMPFAMSIMGGPSDTNGRFRVADVPAGTYGVMAALPRITRSGGAAGGGLSFGDAARPGAAPEVTVQGDTRDLRVVASQP